jgi:hypothetical protein
MEVVLLPDIVEAEEGYFGLEKAEKLSTGKKPSFSTKTGNKIYEENQKSKCRRI